MATSSWIRPEDFLQAWSREAPPEAPATGGQGARARLKQREGFVAAVALMGMAHLTGSRWLFTLPEEDPPDALAVRSVCHGAYTGEPLRMPIEVVGVPAHALAGAAGEIETRLLSFLRAKKLDTKRYIAGTVLCVHLASMRETCCPDSLAELIGAHADAFAEIWLLVEAGADKGRFHVHQVYPRRSSTLVDVAAVNNADDVVA